MTGAKPGGGGLRSGPNWGWARRGMVRRGPVGQGTVRALRRGKVLEWKT
jgi:hypothetical protein